jgi:hypothetical protein
MSAEQVIDQILSQTVKCSDNFASESDAAAVLPTESSPGELKDSRARIAAAENRFADAARSYTSARSFGVPVLLLSLALLAVYEPVIFSWANLQQQCSFWTGVVILWSGAAVSAASIFHYNFRRRYVKAKDGLLREQQSYMALRLSTEAGRRQYFREELFRLSSKAARVFFGDEQRFAVASVWVERAGNILDGTDKTSSLSVVQSFLNQLNELVAREEREQAEETKWQSSALAVMSLYVIVIVVSAVLTNNSPSLLGTRVFHVPLFVILWGAAGSLAAILYRFYTEQGQIRFASEFRWLIARPIIGIIMGAVVYLALFSGLILVSASGPAGGDDMRREAFCIIAFLAGFSDKFYLGVIDLLVARTVRTQEIDSNTVITQSERIPDTSGADAQGDKKPVAQPAAG